MVEVFIYTATEIEKERLQRKGGNKLYITFIAVQEACQCCSGSPEEPLLRDRWA